MSEIIQVRASSWGSLFDCAHKWEGVHILKMRSVSGLRSVLGTSLHASTAAFDQARVEGKPISADDAAEVFVQKLHRPEGNVNYRGEDITLKKAEAIGLTLHTRYCTEISPRYEFRAVEMTCKPLDIDCGNGIVIRLTGTMDRARIYRGSGGVGINDLKSGKRAVEDGAASIKGHAPQIGTYELIYEHTTGERVTEPGEIIGLKTSGDCDIGTGVVRGARELLLGTAEEPGLIEYAAEMFRSGLFPPNPQSRMCGEKYCPRWTACRFKNQ